MPNLRLVSGVRNDSFNRMGRFLEAVVCIDVLSGSVAIAVDYTYCSARASC